MRPRTRPAPCPSDRAAIEMRPPSSTRMASMKPSPSLPSRFSAGITQSSKIISAVSLARRPSLFSFLPGRNPFVPFSTMNAESPCVLRGAVGHGDAPPSHRHSGRWCKKFWCRSAPSRCRGASRSCARCPRPIPAEGSVNPHAPMNSPVASLLTYFFFCASLPARKM